MANFTWEIKRELLLNAPIERGAAAATFAAMLATGGSAYEGPRVEFVSENERVAEYFLRLAELAFGVRFEVKEATLDPKRERDKLTFSCFGADAARIIKETGFWRKSRRYIDNRELAAAYLRGAFLGGGSCTLPHGGARTGYHLEFVMPTKQLAEGLREALDGLYLVSGLVTRGERYIVYIKSREGISDLLSVLGATSALKTIEGVSAAREESNNFNRVSNCFAGNADKAAIASANQVMAFKKLEETGALIALDETLKSTALARLEHPELSLAELAELLNVTKGGLNHRIRKLMALSAQTDKKV